MPVRMFFVMTLVLSILVVQFTAARLYDNGEDAHDEYRLLKRVLLHKSIGASTPRAQNVIDPLSTEIDACYQSPCLNGGTCLNVHDGYWCKCANDYYGMNCQSKFYTPRHPKNHCRPNICNTGRCVSLKTTYHCQCPDDRYGEHCEKRSTKRGVSSAQPYYNLSPQLKRAMFKQDMRNMQGFLNKPEVAYYDPRNGIYF